MKAALRKIRLLVLVVEYFAVGFSVRLLTRDPDKKRHRATLVTSWASKKALKTLNAKVTFDGLPSPSRPGLGRPGRLLISNHMSYVDILVMSSQWPCVFVTSVETEHSPFIGIVSKLGGSLFVERRNKSRLKADIQMISDVIKRGFDVVIFPEGTSSNGEAMLPFKKSLITAALGTETEVVPLCLNYVSVNGDQVHLGNRDLLFYYGDMTFGPHFGSALRHLRHFEAHVKILKPIPVGPESCRKAVTQKAFEMINQHFRPIPSSSFH